MSKDLEIETQEQEGPKYPSPPQPSRYFGQPKNWYKGLGYLLELNRRQDLASQMEFHRVALKEVKKALGSKCKHLIHVKNTDGEVTFQAKMLIDEQMTIFNVTADHKDPSLFTAETYKSVNDVLQKHLKGDVKGS